MSEQSMEEVQDDDGKVEGLERILDIPLVVSVELGRTSIQVGELLQLAQGSIVELTKLAGEPLDVLVHGKLVARGEAVVINDQFGVRLTDIVSPTERIASLKENGS
ncbi:MAG TPA: flagellar motor switch protein FliN [Myxococcales bacterium LLY-WYZ-16_1]|nr:flagellar motor switch protein FliN [Myxococcales bacterium LLY-WYZ-16_1]